MVVDLIMLKTPHNDIEGTNHLLKHEHTHEYIILKYEHIQDTFISFILGC